MYTNYNVHKLGSGNVLEYARSAIYGLVLLKDRGCRDVDTFTHVAKPMGDLGAMSTYARPARN